ncbi:hypothetical protein RRG08_065433 [Elysia crispata]|uniref:Uncharacterized protein n=1 Tax=Elysia crispata TaxID=231223 RepID=A0AAE0ZEW8_9GAST|nr:hypothetical protein RRG08_065433 [Elysia crispata]
MEESEARCPAEAYGASQSAIKTSSVRINKLSAVTLPRREFLMSDGRIRALLTPSHSASLRLYERDSSCLFEEIQIGFRHSVAVTGSSSRHPTHHVSTSSRYPLRQGIHLVKVSTSSRYPPRQGIQRVRASTSSRNPPRQGIHRIKESTSSRHPPRQGIHRATASTHQGIHLVKASTASRYPPRHSIHRITASTASRHPQHCGIYSIVGSLLTITS